MKNPIYGITSRCPKRIEEGGIVGTQDLGFCLNACAAFHITDAMNNNEGTCSEYKCTVFALSEGIRYDIRR